MITAAYGLLIALAGGAIVAPTYWGPFLRLVFFALLFFVYIRVFARAWVDGSLKRSLPQIYDDNQVSSARRTSVTAKLETAAVIVGTAAAILFVL